MGCRLLALAFVVLALPSGLLLALRVPLGQVPDEPHHAMRAYALAHGQMVGDHTAAVMTDPALADVMTLPPIPLPGEHVSMTPERLAASRAVEWNDGLRPVHLGSIAGYFPIFYAPAAAALEAARLIGASPYDAFLAARLANLLAFVLLGAAGLVLARRGAALLCAVLLLPMTLGLAASASQDGLLIAATVLALAMLGRAADRPEVSRAGWYRGAAVLLAGIAAVKPPYLPLLALLLLPLQGRADLSRRAAIAVLACLPALAWVALTSDVAAVGHDMPPYEAGPLWPGPRPAVFDGSDAAAQWRVLLAQPWRLVTLPAATLWHDKLALASQVIGALGWLNRLLPRWLYAAWFFALAAAMLADTTGPAEAPRNHRPALEAALLLAAAIASALGIMLALYLTWSPVGAALIIGEQGRYFLPLLPLLGRAVPILPDNRRLRWLALAPLSVAALDLALLPRLLTEWFYLP